MIKLTTSKLLSLSTIAIAANAFATNVEEADLFSMTLEELSRLQVVSAVTGYEYKLSDAPASVTIIEAKEWQARGNETLYQALAGIVGVQMGVINGSSTENQPIIRGLAGIFGQQIKLLIDGVAFNRIHHGGTLALDIPLLGFKRIEVIRSSGSAIYGADAFAGIINLVSYETDYAGQEIRLSGGSFDTHSAAFTGGKAFKEFKVRYTFNYRQFGDDPNRVLSRDFQSSLDDQFGTSASLAPGRIDQSNEQMSVNLKANYKQTRLSYYGIIGSFGFGAGVVEALNPDGEGHHHSHLLELQHQFTLFGEENTTLSLWYQDKHSSFPFTLFPAGVKLPIGEDGNLNFGNPSAIIEFPDGLIGHPGNNSTLSQAAITQIFSPNDSHQIRWQVGFEHHHHKPFEEKNFGPGILNGNESVVDGTLTDVTDTEFSFLPKKSRHFTFVSLQDSWSITDSLTFHLGGRYDHYSDFGSTINPRTGFVWKATNRLTVKIFSANAFRAPSFYDLYAINNPVNLGNPDLEPEKITTNELDLAFKVSENLQSELTLYNYRAKDLIEYSSREGSTGAYATNLGSIRGKGIEWRLRWRPMSSLDVNANYSKLNSKDTNGFNRPDFADEMASIAANYTVNERLNINLMSQYLGEQQRKPTDARAPVSSYVWTSASITYQMNALPMDVSLTINNVGNVNGAYPSRRLAEDYPIAGRQWLLQMNYKI